ncbi:hypothetical protein ACQRE0_22235, partial [Victivallis vadensis]
NIRFAADRGENGHSDRFWAGALAIHAHSANDGPCFMAVPERPAAAGGGEYDRYARYRTGRNAW